MAETTDQEVSAGSAKSPPAAAVPVESSRALGEAAPATEAGNRRFRSFARSLGRAARWTTLQADMVTQKAVGLAGKVVPIRTGADDEASLEQLCQQLVELVQGHSDNAVALAQDTGFWKLVRRLHRKRRRARAADEQASTGADEAAASGKSAAADEAKAARPKKPKAKAASPETPAAEPEPPKQES